MHSAPSEKNILLYCIDTLFEILNEGDKQKNFDFADAIHNIPEIYMQKRNLYSFRKELKAFQKKYGKHYFAFINNERQIPMTKQKVLQGALALNGDDKQYTVTAEDDKITIEAKYYGTVKRKATFRFTAHLRDDGTYTETSFDSDGYGMQYGSFAKTKKSVSFTFGEKNDGPEVEKDSFDSEDCKRVLREYLAGCGYEKQGLFQRLFGKK